MVARLSALHTGCNFLPGFFLRFLVLISVRGWVDPRAIVWPQGLCKLEKIHLIGTQSRDLPACSIVPLQIEVYTYICAIFINFSINFLISLSQRGHTHVCVCLCVWRGGGMAVVWLNTKVNRLMPIGILLTPVSITMQHFLNLSWRVALGWASMQDCEYSVSFHGLNTEIYTNKDVYKVAS
jgi:hypothetical protein